MKEIEATFQASINEMKEQQRTQDEQQKRVSEQLAAMQTVQQQQTQSAVTAAEANNNAMQQIQAQFKQMERRLTAEKNNVRTREEAGLQQGGRDDQEAPKMTG